MNRALLAALILLVGTGLIAGFAVVGGPKHARMERHDSDRAEDLRRLGNYYMGCRDARLFENENAPPTCGKTGGPPLVKDPVTDAPYNHQRLGEDRFEICARFQTETQQQRTTAYLPLAFEGQVGCLRYSRAGAGDTWTFEQP